MRLSARLSDLEARLIPSPTGLFVIPRYLDQDHDAAVAVHERSHGAIPAENERVLHVFIRKPFPSPTGG